MKTGRWLSACLSAAFLMPATAFAGKPKCGPSDLKTAELLIVYGTKDSLRAADIQLGQCAGAVKNAEGNSRVFFLHGFLYYVQKDYNRTLLGFGLGLRSPNPNKTDFIEVMQRMVEARDKRKLDPEPLNRIVALADTQIWPKDDQIAELKKKVNPDEEQTNALKKQVGEEKPPK